MRTPARSSSIVRAVDLRDRRQRLGLTADRMADYLEAELTERRQALAIAMADEWARAKGYKMTVTQSLDAAAGE